MPALARPRLSTLCATLLLLGALPSAGAIDSFSWTGAASGQWSEAANWAGGSAPSSGAGTQLFFDSPNRPTSFNDIAGGLVLNGLTLGANAGAMTLSGQPLVFQGTAAFLRMQSGAGHSRIQNQLQLGTDLTLSGGPALDSQLFLQGSISGTAGLQLDSGIAVLSGSNSYSGLTRVGSGASLGVAGNGVAGSSGLVVEAGGQLQLVRLASNSPTVLTAPMQLAGLLSSSAKKMSDLIGLPTASAFVSGPITLSGDARITAFGATGTGFDATELVISSGVQRAGHALTLSTGGINNSLRLSGALSGDGDLLLQPDGGSLQLGSLTGHGDILVRGSGGLISTGAIAGNGRLDVAAASVSMNVNGALTGARHLRVSDGALTLGQAAHSFSGSIVLRELGTLNVGNEGLLGNAANTLRFENGGLLRLTGQELSAVGSLTRAIHTTGGIGAIDVGAGLTRSVSATISGDGGINFFNFGLRSLITLSGANSFEGGLVIGQGVLLAFNEDVNLGAAGGAIHLGGGLVMPAGYTLTRPVELLDLGSSVSGASAAHEISSDLRGSGRLNLGGATSFTLSGNNSHGGGVGLAGESSGAPTSLVIDSDARLGAAGGVLDIGRQNGFFVLPGRLVAAANLSIDASRSTSFREMTVDSQGFEVVFNQPISGRGMVKTGEGLWRLNTANSDNSNVNEVRVLQGTLQLGINEALGSRASVSVAAGGVLDLAGRQLTPTTINVAEGGELQLGQGGSLRMNFGQFDGVISGSGNLQLGLAGFSGGSGSFNAANSFSGSISVLHGARLVLGHAQALGAAGNSLLLDQGSLSTSHLLEAPVVINAAMALQIGAGGAGFMAEGQSLIIERQLTGSSPLRFQGGSDVGASRIYDVRLAHTANSFVGPLQLGDPTGFGNAIIGITADGSLGAAGNTVTLGARHFDGESTRSASGGLRAWADLSLAASRIVQLDGVAGERNGWIDSNGFSFAIQGGIGELSAGMSLLKTGAGTLVLNGINSYSGLTQVQEGALGGHGEVARLEIGSEATLAPGESAGLFSVREDLSFSGGLLWMELGGLARGTQFDALDVGGSVELGGAVLKLSFIEGFGAQAQAGQSFLLLQAGGGIFGQFSNVASGERLLTADGTGSFLVRYGEGQGLLLSDYAVAAVPEPSSYALLLSGLGLLSWMARRRRRDAGHGAAHFGA